LILGRQLHLLILGAGAAGAGLFAMGFLFLIWPNARKSARDRLVKHAWNLLVPDMLKDDLDKGGWSFLSGLVELSEEVPRFKLNHDLLLSCAEEASDAGKDDPYAVLCLATLNRRCLDHLRETGEDPFDYICTLASECFKGKLPLSFLCDLFETFRGKQRSSWSKCDQNRLPILVAHHAFSADVDVEDWLNLGRAFPALSSTLNLEQRAHWLQFHALWSRRNRKPWENAGPAANMLELADEPARVTELLSYYPDVLLYIAESNIVIGTKGVWLEGVCVTSFGPSAEVLAKRVDRGWELLVGAQIIRAPEDPRAHLANIKRWLRWYFQEFLPTVSTAPRPMVESRHRMWQLGKVACPECGKSLVPCPGDLGVALR
jgi:hypothetical protein